jgi:hypothetical protein
MTTGRINQISIFSSALFKPCGSSSASEKKEQGSLFEEVSCETTQIDRDASSPG